MFILNTYQKITQRPKKQQSIQQGQKAGFTNNNDAIYAELKPQLGNRTL